MGAFRIIFSTQADRDLVKIVRYISRDNPDAAARFGNKLIDRALTLADSSAVNSGARLPKRREKRRLIEGNYLIYYQVYPEYDEVRILRFRHAAQDTHRMRLKV